MEKAPEEDKSLEMLKVTANMLAQSLGFCLEKDRKPESEESDETEETKRCEERTEKAKSFLYKHLKNSVLGDKDAKKKEKDKEKAEQENKKREKEMKERRKVEGEINYYSDLYQLRDQLQGNEKNKKEGDENVLTQKEMKNDRAFTVYLQQLNGKCKTVINKMRNQVQFVDGCMDENVLPHQKAAVENAEKIIIENGILIEDMKNLIIEHPQQNWNGQTAFHNVYKEDRLPEELRGKAKQVDVRREGACFWQSVSMALIGSMEYSEALKLITVDYFVKNKDHIKNLSASHQSTYEKNFNRVLGETHYATDFQIAALAAALETPIQMYQYNINEGKPIPAVFGKDFEGIYPSFSKPVRNELKLQYVSAAKSKASTYVANHYIALLSLTEKRQQPE